MPAGRQLEKYTKRKKESLKYGVSWWAGLGRAVLSSMWLTSHCRVYCRRGITYIANETVLLAPGTASNPNFTRLLFVKQKQFLLPLMSAEN